MLLSGNLRKSVLEMPPAAMTRCRGEDIKPSFAFFLTLFAAGGGTGVWRPVGSEGGSSSDEPHRLCFELVA